MSFQAYDKMSPSQLRLVKDLWRRSGFGGPVTVPLRQRRPVPALWRRGLIEVWHRQVPDDEPGVRGPFYRLTLDGCRLASSIFHPLNRRDAA